MNFSYSEYKYQVAYKRTNPLKLYSTGTVVVSLTGRVLVFALLVVVSATRSTQYLQPVHVLYRGTTGSNNFPCRISFTNQTASSLIAPGLKIIDHGSLSHIMKPQIIVDSNLNNPSNPFWTLCR